jgi:hypothetical protein
MKYDCVCGRCPLCRQNSQERADGLKRYDLVRKPPGRRQFSANVKPSALSMRRSRQDRLIREVYHLDKTWPGVPVLSMRRLASR